MFRTPFHQSLIVISVYCRDCLDLSLVLQLFGAEIRHFVQQLKYYISCGVSKCVWENLVKQVQFIEDLGNPVNAHQPFLSNAFTRCLLDAESCPLLGQLGATFTSISDYTRLRQDFNTTLRHENGELN
ncbi:unnamed protein product [Schistosoma mattheei]|uniref:Uncharacterized protein n=1 Tax=Schistosoma mattheei TaxID=31246 RepID=A0A183PXK6_9TREM|nr:unnamed protein product [Schistosoma mattheei]